MQEIEIAVQWWLDQMKNRTVGTSGDGDIDAFFILAMRGGNVPPLTEEQISAFQAGLTRLLSKHLEKYGYCSLLTDYGPEEILRDVCLEAKIDDVSSRLPLKTIMSIRRGKVYVRCGYGAREVVLYGENANVSHNHPAQ